MTPTPQDATGTMSLSELLTAAEPYLVGVWRYSERGRSEQWCCSVHVGGEFFDLPPSDTMREALQQVVDEWYADEKPSGPPAGLEERREHPCMVNRNGDWFFTDGWDVVWRLAVTGDLGMPLQIVKWGDAPPPDRQEPTCPDCGGSGWKRQAGAKSEEQQAPCERCHDPYHGPVVQDSGQSTPPDTLCLHCTAESRCPVHQPDSTDVPPPKTAQERAERYAGDRACSNRSPMHLLTNAHLAGQREGERRSAEEIRRAREDTIHALEDRDARAATVMAQAEEIERIAAARNIYRQQVQSVAWAFAYPTDGPMAKAKKEIERLKGENDELLTKRREAVEGWARQEARAVQAEQRCEALGTDIIENDEASRERSEALQAENQRWQADRHKIELRVTALTEALEDCLVEINNVALGYPGDTDLHQLTVRVGALLSSPEEPAHAD